MIYFKGGDTAVDLVDLLSKGFSTSEGFFRVTYDDPEFKYKQCHSARRSLDDLLEIANTYFPNTSDKDVLSALNKINTGNYILLVFYCSDIEKPVFRLQHDYGFNKKLRGFQFEWSECDRFGKSAYSLETIYALIERLDPEETSTTTELVSANEFV